MWLLEKTIFDAMENAPLPSVAEQQAYEETFEALDGARIMSSSGGKANVRVEGVLTGKPSFMAQFFGGGNTTYKEIQGALAIANADTNIEEIDMFVNSPGGEASADWIATMDAIKNSPKKVNAIVGNMAASAGYGLVSQATTITAQNRMSLVGSIGVVAQVRKNDNVVTVTSDNAPNKNPDPSKEDGLESLKERLNAQEAIFIEAIAEGRGVSTSTVKKDFGQGGVVLAAEALSKGMIDSIVDSPIKQTALSGKQNKESFAMDIKELEAQHPQLFAEAKQLGTDAEMTRVKAHIHMGKECDALDIAMAAIEDGLGFDHLVTAKYLTAGRNNTDIKASASDSEDIVVVASDKKLEEKEERSLEDLTADALEAQLGLETE